MRLGSIALQHLHRLGIRQNVDQCHCEKIIGKSKVTNLVSFQ